MLQQTIRKCSNFNKISVSHKKFQTCQKIVQLEFHAKIPRSCIERRLDLTTSPKNFFSTSSSLRERSNYSPLFYFDMSSKHLSKGLHSNGLLKHTGSTCPPLQPGKLRLYSMRYCPFAQRAVLVALAKGIPHDVVNCHLKEKPEWLWERNCNGKVPVLEFSNGKILYESLIVADYFDEAFQNRPLNSPAPFQKALDKIWIEEFRKIISVFYKILFAVKSEDHEALQEHINKFKLEVGRFEQELTRRETTFFGGNNLPGMLDYMIWPWVERLPAMKSFVKNEFLDADEEKRKHPRLETWRKAMKEDFAVKEFFLPVEVHKEFIQSFLNGNPNYDIIEAKL